LQDREGLDERRAGGWALSGAQRGGRQRGGPGWRLKGSIW
jgi:hypothetical protein